jgi:hypothetical protein
MLLIISLLCRDPGDDDMADLKVVEGRIQWKAFEGA